MAATERFSLTGKDSRPPTYDAVDVHGSCGHRSDVSGDIDDLWGPVHLVNEVVLPKDITPKFLRLHGSIEYNWNVVTAVTHVPFVQNSGLSNASMYYCVLTLKREDTAETSRHSSRSGSSGSGGSLHGPVQPVLGRRCSGLGSSSSGGRRRSADAPHLSDDGGDHCSTADDAEHCPLNASSVHRHPPLQAATTGESRRRERTTASSKPAAVGSLLRRFVSRVASSGLLDHLPGSPSGTGETGGGAAALPSPPQVIILKHYDTSDVETPSMVLRWFRHVTHNTLDDMYRHELIFYVLVRPLLALYREKYCTPRCFFAARVDRGTPSFCRYVCCRHGSGSVASIGIEDMTRSGYSFAHAERQGFADIGVILACVYAAAHLHSAMWGRPSLDPALRGIEASSILLGVHRIARGLDTRIDLRRMELRRLILVWQGYAPLLRLDAVVRAIAHTQRLWPDIRSKAVEIVKANTTLLHGDFHFKNIGVRRRMGPQPPGWNPRLPFSDAEIVSVDFQNFGYGSGVAELLYFICTSLPVEILVAPRYSHATVALLDDGEVGSEQQTVLTTDSFGVSPANKTESGRGSRNSSFVGTSTVDDRGTVQCEGGTSTTQQRNTKSSTTGETSSGCWTQNPLDAAGPVTEAAAGHRAAAPSSVSPSTDQAPLFPRSPKQRFADSDDAPPMFPHQMKMSDDFISFPTLEQLRQFDECLLRCYYLSLSSEARAAIGGFASLSETFYLLARHWAATILMDLSHSSVTERQAQKAKPELSRLVEWGEKTSARVLLTIASLHAAESSDPPLVQLDAPRARHGSFTSSHAGSDILQRLIGQRVRRGSLSPAQNAADPSEQVLRSKTM